MSGTAAHALAVGAGAAAGGMLRWALIGWLNPWWSAGFPLGTLAVNLAGGLAVGAALAWFAQPGSNEWLRLLLVPGFLGGLTTFSAFSGESLVLLQRGQALLALAHSAAHLLGALACAALGYALARAWMAG
jgi:CrcB protein